MRQIVQMLWIHIVTNYTQKRVLFAIILQWLYMYSILNPILAFADEFNLDIRIILYPFLHTDPIYIIVITLSFLLILSNIPMNNEMQSYLIHRTSTSKWITSQIIYIIVSIFIYIINIMLSYIVISFSYITFHSNDWGKLIGSLNYYPDIINQFEITINIPSTLMVNYTPLQLFIMTLVMMILIFFFSGLMLILFNIIRPGLGLVLYSVFIFLYLAIRHFDKFYGFYISVFSWISLSNISTSQLDGYPTLSFAITILVTGIIIMIIVIYYIAYNDKLRRKLILWNN